MVSVAAGADAVEVYCFRKERRQRRCRGSEERVRRETCERETEPLARRGSRKEQRWEHETERGRDSGDQRVSDCFPPQELAHAQRAEHLTRESRLVDRELVQRERQQREDRGGQAEYREADAAMSFDPWKRHASAAIGDRGEDDWHEQRRRDRGAPARRAKREAQLRERDRRRRRRQARNHSIPEPAERTC